MLIFPESPRWLFDQHREAEALEILADLHGEGNQSDELVVLEFEEIKQQVHNTLSAVYHFAFHSSFSLGLL